MVPVVDVNYIAVLVAAIVSMIIGALWFSPVLFGKMWMQLSGMTDKKLQEAKKKGIGKSYIIMFVATLVMGYVLAHAVQYTQAKTIMEGMQAGFWMWLGCIATVMVGMVLWDKKPVKLYLLLVAHYLVSLLVMGAILAVWS